MAQVAAEQKREPFPALVVEDVMDYPPGFLVILSRFVMAIKNLALSRARYQASKRPVGGLNMRQPLAIRETDEAPRPEPAIERTYRQLQA